MWCSAAYFYFYPTTVWAVLPVGRLGRQPTLDRPLSPLRFLVLTLRPSPLKVLHRYANSIQIDAKQAGLCQVLPVAMCTLPEKPNQTLRYTNKHQPRSICANTKLHNVKLRWRPKQLPYPLRELSGTTNVFSCLKVFRKKIVQVVTFMGVKLLTNSDLVLNKLFKSSKRNNFRRKLTS